MTENDEHAERQEKSQIPADDTYFLKARVQSTLVGVRETSPRQVFGEELLRFVAAELDRENKTEKQVTPLRLAMALRCHAKLVPTLLNATSRPGKYWDSRTSYLDHDASAPTASANAAARKEAAKKLRQARKAIDKGLRLLNSAEVAVFADFDPEAATPLQDEIEIVESELRVPLAERRGHPALALVIGDIHRAIYRLTGSWHRGPRTENNQDERIANILFSLVRRLAPESLPDESISSAIETSIKTKKNINDQ